jgi:hypothetical protein
VTSSATATAGSISGKGVFTARFMAGVAYMASSIPRLIPVEVVERLRTALRHRSTVTLARVVAVVDVAVKAVRAVKPGAGSKKHPAIKPIGPIVAIGSTVIWLIVEVPIGAHRRHSDADANLRWPKRRTAQQCNCQNRESKDFSVEHSFSSFGLETKRQRQAVSPVQSAMLDN